MNLNDVMRRVPLMACLLALSVAALAQGAQELTEVKPIDQQLYNTLRDVINRGREYYNNNDPSACYFMFQGALQVARPLLAHRPELQRTITDGLAEAEAQPDMRRRAWSLRMVLDKVRNGVRSDVARSDKIDDKKMPELKGPEVPPPPAKMPEKDTKPAEPTLWDKLGGLPAVTKVVDEFVTLAADDPKVNFSRDGKYKFDDNQLAALKKNLVAFVSQASGGPIKYAGKSMKEVHKDMAITDDEFDATVDVLVKVLEKNEIKDEEITAVKKAVEGTRKDIVMKKAE